MRLELELFIREHRSGLFSIQVLGSPDLRVYGPSLEQAKEDLTLVIGDRVERTHPRLQSTWSAGGSPRIETVELPEALVVEAAAGKHPAPTRLSMLVTEARAWRTVWFPRLDLHAWLPKRAADLERAVLEILRAHFERLDDAARLSARFERKEWLEKLAVDAQPPPLSAFTGKRRGLELLPIGAGEEEEKKEKKKRPDTPTLRKIGVSLSHLAEKKELETAFERDAEVEALYAMLASGADQPAIAVIGASGVGKTTLLNALVHRLRAPDVPEALRTREVWFADASRLVAGEGWFGDWQRQCLDVVEEVEKAEVLWSVGPLLPLLDAGKNISSEQNVAQILKPFISARRLAVIGECTASDWAKLELREPSFARLFTPFRVEEPPDPAAKKILDRVAAQIAREEHLEIAESGITAVRELTARYASGTSRLGAAVHFLRRAAGQLAASGGKLFSRKEAVAAFSRETGLPEHLIRDDLPLDPERVRAAFEERLIGQDDAVRRMVDLVAVIKAGMSDLSRPLGSFLFVGPTGVGKTETAKALAAYLFGGEHRLIRFDMSEYATGEAVHRFLGDRASEGKLVEAIRRRPFSVVLLDEIEKAHPAIFDVLLQVLGEARLTDEAGRTGDFRNAVVIMTSNLGVESARRGMGFAKDGARANLDDHFAKEVERFFRPELFNRIDHVVPFAPLEAEQIERIAHRELDKIARCEGLFGRGLALAIDPQVASWAAERGTDLRYGARPLKRVLERALTIPLARHLSRHRSTSVHASVRDGALELTARGEAASREEAADLVELLGRIGDLRFRVARWMGSTGYRDVVHEVRLVDQLSKHPQFWAQRELAEKRAQSAEVARALAAAFERELARLADLEDLGLEAYHERRPEPAQMIEDELRGIARRAEDLELQLYARRFDSPDRGVLYLLPARGSGKLLRELITIYGEIALAERFTLEVWIASRPEEPKEPKAKEKEKEEKPKPKPKPKPRPSAAVKWVKRATVDPAAEKAPTADELRGWLRGELGTLHDDDAAALIVAGRHARAIFASEGGQHLFVAGGEGDSLVTAEVRDAPEGGALVHPADLPARTDRARTIHERKRIVLDHVLDQHVALEARASKNYRRLMRGRMIHAVFGEAGLPWFRAWEQP